MNENLKGLSALAEIIRKNQFATGGDFVRMDIGKTAFARLAVEVDLVAKMLKGSSGVQMKTLADMGGLSEVSEQAAKHVKNLQDENQALRNMLSESSDLAHHNIAQNLVRKEKELKNTHKHSDLTQLDEHNILEPDHFPSLAQKRSFVYGEVNTILTDAKPEHIKLCLQACEGYKHDDQLKTIIELGGFSEVIRSKQDENQALRNQLRTAELSIQICPLGSFGRAYDKPEVTRAYTCDDQPGNGAAMRLGSAVRECNLKKWGDEIDIGLNLLRTLKEQGFGVFELPKIKIEKHLIT